MTRQRPAHPSASRYSEEADGEGEGDGEGDGDGDGEGRGDGDARGAGDDLVVGCGGVTAGPLGTDSDDPKAATLGVCSVSL